MIKTKPSLTAFILSLLFLSVLSGCGDGSSGSSSNEASGKSASVKLVIVNQEGDITQGTLLVQDGNRKEVLSTTLEGITPYSLTVPSGIEYPILVTITPDPTIYKKFNSPLKALVISAMSGKVRVSQKSTAAVEYVISQLNGVFSKENIATATMATFTPDRRPARSYKGGMARISGK